MVIRGFFGTEMMIGVLFAVGSIFIGLAALLFLFRSRIVRKIMRHKRA